MKRIAFLLFLLTILSQVPSKGQTNTLRNNNQKNLFYFACPPCGIDCDTMHFPKPGICPVCSMKLYAASSGKENTNGNHFDISKKNVAVLLFDGVEIIDFAGPWEVFGAAGMNVYSVASTDSTILTTMGLRIKPDYIYSNAPIPDIILIPGGNVNADDSLAKNWISTTNLTTEHTMSVCTGAFYLASAGLLDGITATTNYPAIDQLKQMAPKTNVLSNVRYVDNGKIITSAGLSSGIDAAFHLVSLYIGEAETKRLANSLEYNWNDSIYFVRSKLADKYLQDFFDVLIPYNYKMTKYYGNEKEWVTEIYLQTDVDTEELSRLFDLEFSQVSGWNKASQQWTFTENGQSWRATLDRSKNTTSQQILTFRVAQE